MPETDFRLLLVEDEQSMIKAVQLAVEQQYSLDVASTVASALAAIERDPPDVILLDIGLPDGSGMDVLKEARRRDPPVDVIVITASQDVSTAVQVMKLGAQDYLQKPFAYEDLLLCIQRAYDKWQLQKEVARLRSEILDEFHWGNIIGQSPALMRALRPARKMALSESAVLLTGESGTGKDLIARAIHSEGMRSKGPFVAINCAQFSATMLESELFGHEKGAFTGAVAQRRGRFELADRGTLFLDEVGSMPQAMQAGLLRVLETHQFERVGGERTLTTDFRLIAATNNVLESAVQKGDFRQDLYYRLNVVQIEIPPLRDRRDDIPLLCHHFLMTFSSKAGGKPKTITPEAMTLLMAWDWPGNIRELRNVLEMAYALEEGDYITSRCFPIRMKVAKDVKRLQEGEQGQGNVLDMMVSEYEHQLLEEYLGLNGWNQLKTAQSLGIHRNTIDKKIQKYGIVRPRGTAK